MAQQAEFRNDKDIDMLSSLPDHILCHIISLLPIKATIRTSVLSRRWRYLFAQNPNLTIDDTVENLPYPHSSLVSPVNKLLSYPERARLSKLCIKLVRKGVASSVVDELIYDAVCHGVQELELCISNQNDNVMFNELHRGSLFTCKTLVRLGLKFSEDCFREIPDTVCLPNLKILHLERMNFKNPESVQRLFSQCCMLEELVVQRCGWKSVNKFCIINPTLKRLTLRSLVCPNPRMTWSRDTRCLRLQLLEINAPSLVYFEHFDVSAARYSFLNLQSLVEARIHFGIIDLDPYNDHDAAAEMLQGISHNIQSLHVGSRFLKAHGHYRYPEFPNLTYLNITISFNSLWGSIVARSPCLETLVIDLAVPWLLDRPILPRTVPSCFRSHLKEIRVLSFCGDYLELDLVKYFLMNAQVLQNLTVDGVNGEKELQEITEALETIPRASKHCHVNIA